MDKNNSVGAAGGGVLYLDVEARNRGYPSRTLNWEFV